MLRKDYDQLSEEEKVIARLRGVDTETPEDVQQEMMNEDQHKS